MAKEITIDVFSASSIDSAIRELDAFKDWLAGYADDVAESVSDDLVVFARDDAHLQSGRLIDSIRSEYVSDGVYKVIADPVNPRSKNDFHYAEIEHDRTDPIHVRETKSGVVHHGYKGRHDFFNLAVEDMESLNVIPIVAMEKYTW